MMRFGTDGIRGKAGVPPIDTAGAAAVGRAAAQTASAGRVLVARDRRPSGVELQDALVAGVVEAGGCACIAGVLPTAGASEAIARGLADVAIVLTASHNPADDNGFKLLMPGGKKPSDEDVRAFEQRLVSGGVLPRGGSVEGVEGRAYEAYTAALASRVDTSAFADQELVIDLANGASAVMREWLASLGPGVSFIAAGDGVENDRCGAVYPQRLGVAVRERGARCGLAVDGDGDRCVLVDERGEPIHGDVLGWWLATCLGVEGLAATVMSTHALEAALGGSRVVRTPVGDRHLQAAMGTHGLSLGFEESGHVLFDDGLPTGCGLLTGLRALAPLLAEPRAISRQLAGFVPWPRALAKVIVSSRPPLEELEELQNAISRAEERLGGGRTLLRYSGTEPVLRVLVEGPDERVVSDCCAELCEVAHRVVG